MHVRLFSAPAFAVAMSLSKSRKNLSLVPHRKRRKENPTQSSEPLHEFINKLPDALLLEIFYRLPRRSAHRFKSVSKHWSSLISDPYFVRGFIHHRHQFNKSNSSDSNSNPFTLMFQYYFRSTKTILLLPSYNSGDSDFGDDFLNFLPNIKRRARKDYHYIITASFNDLLLLYSEVKEDFILNFKPGFCEYCVCNPLTKQWVTLPHLPFNSNKDVIVGFTCDPYSCDKEQGCKTHAHYRYKVVRIHSPTQPNTTQLRMQIFSSDTGEWCNSVVSSPRGLNSFNLISKNAGVVVCNAMLHWGDYNNRGLLQGIFVFDPFNDAERCRYIVPPIGFSSIKDPVSLGVFRGHLRMIQHPSPWRYGYHPNARSFSIWELEDYDNGGTWCLKHTVYFRDMILEHPVLAELVKESSSSIVLLPAFHPNDEKIFFKLRNYFLRCNLQTMVLEIVDELEETWENIVYNAKSVFLLEQQSWPTPVPPLPLKFK